MRGPETAQFGMTLSLLARYFNYTRDRALLLKHQSKIEATATLLCELHSPGKAYPRTRHGCRMSRHSLGRATSRRPFG